MKTRNTILAVGFAAVAASLPIAPASGQTATFNFDNGAGELGAGQAVPFTQVVPGQAGDTWRAQFAAPKNGFVIQTTEGAGARMPGLDGLILWSITESDNVLEINFDRLLTNVRITFATLEAPRTPASRVDLMAYLGTTAGTPTGKTFAVGDRTQGDYPTGTLSLTATGRPFDAVRIIVEGDNAHGLAIDSIVATAERCQADFDGDDAKRPTVAVQDIFAFLNSWFGRELRSDFNHDGEYNATDILDFVNAWIMGCP